MARDEFMRKTAEAQLKKNIKKPFKCQVTKSWDWTFKNEKRVKTDTYNIDLVIEAENSVIYTAATSISTLEDACEWALEQSRKDIKNLRTAWKRDTQPLILEWLKTQLRRRYKRLWLSSTGLRFRGWRDIREQEREVERIVKESENVEEALRKTHELTLPKIPKNSIKERP